MHPNQKLAEAVFACRCYDIGRDAVAQGLACKACCVPAGMVVQEVGVAVDQGEQAGTACKRAAADDRLPHPRRGRVRGRQ